jgi:hypothetical protein
MLKRILCFINFNHELKNVSHEEGKGSEYRVIETCNCGKKTNKSDWVDDNILLGYRK